MLSYAGIAAAVDSISLSPGSDITFSDKSDSRLLFVQVNPPEAGVNLVVDVDMAVVEVSSQKLTTDSNGAAELTIEPDCKKGLTFLKVVTGDVESNAIFVENEAGCEGKGSVTIKPDYLRIYWTNNPNSHATILVEPAEITTVTIHNENPDIVRAFLPSPKTDSNGTTELRIIGQQEGTAKVTASLADGTVSNTLTIDVFTDEELITNVTHSELGIKGTATFSVTGGSGLYRWSARNGNLDRMTGNETTYTAPDYPGSFEVIVTDNKQTAKIDVNVTGPLKIVPEQAYPRQGESFEVQAIGGKPPYKFYMTDTIAQVTKIDEDFALVTGLDSRSEFHVVVRDDLGKEAKALLTVVDGMRLSSKEVEIAQDVVPETIEIQNGRHPFDVRVDKGKVKLNDRQIEIFPPLENGTYKLVVRDGIGEVDEAMINVKIPGRLQISPSNLEVELEQTVDFEAIDGKAPYTFTTDKGELSCNNCAVTRLTVTGTDSDITVKVTDNTGAKATAKVKVTPPINVSDRFVSLYQGESKLITVTGGSGIYSYSTDIGGVDNTIQATSEGVIFTAPTHSGEVTLTVTDSRSSEQKVVFDISAVRLAITPSLRHLDLGSKDEDFQIVAGEKDTNLKVWAEKGEVVWEGEKIIYTPPQFVSTDVLKVVSLDSGKEATAKIEITRPLSITPSIMSIASGEASGVFHVSGGVGTYNFTAIYGSFELQSANASETGVDITYISPNVMKNDEVITVRDSNIDGKASAIVELNNPLRITPLMTTLAPGTSFEFIGFRGAAPYSAEWTGGKAEQIHAEVGEVRYRYIAPAEIGEYQITITDASNSKATATIYVTAKLRILPELTVLRPGQSTMIKVSGGSAPYGLFTATFGRLTEIDAQNGEVRYTAPLDFDGNEITAYVKALDTTNDVGVSTEIRVVKTPKSLISANSTTFMAGDNLKINLTSLGGGEAADVYVAVAFPDGQLFFFDENRQPISEQLPFLRNYVVSDETTYQNVFSMESLPDLAQQGQLTLYSLLVKPGTPTQELLNPANWLCENEKECGLSSFELKVK
ncbi:MAG: hypothetical protein DRR19_30625 [Candidatus Parabeggiatoa sp. nov. 1]|nr:MAG: hypothetical protein DRR19_30625 [Gammaproteobacteria bacterium]